MLTKAGNRRRRDFIRLLSNCSGAIIHTKKIISLHSLYLLIFLSIKSQIVLSDNVVNQNNSSTKIKMTFDFYILKFITQIKYYRIPNIY